MILKKYLETHHKANFAKQLGISRVALNHYAEGRRLVPLNIAYLIEKITHRKVTIKDLFQHWNEKNQK